MSWNDNFEWVDNPKYGQEIYPGFFHTTKSYYQPKQDKKFEAVKVYLGLTPEEVDHIQSNEPKNKVVSEPYQVIRGKR